MAEQIRDYSSIYSIKEFMLKDVAPKYFDMVNTNQLNVGLIGYTSEIAANTTEDTFNSVSTFVREIFPNQAQIPETLYNYAANLQIENIFATPSQLDVALFVNERDIASFGKRKENVYEFVLDSDMIVDIEGRQFMLDYDIIITAKQYASDFIYTAQYDFGFQNSLSNQTNPYIKTTRINMNGGKYLGLMVQMHQVNKFEQTDYIINNDKINLPTLSIEFIDQLANFEVFYKEPGAPDYVQLKKRMIGTTPLREPFCFYRIKEENKIEISFTMRDNYFQPKFNSEIVFNYYTTKGSGGNFPEYQGNNVSVIPRSSTYDYNNSIILFAIPQGESLYGNDKLTLEELRAKIIERSSTSGAYNVENDLQLYFANYEYRDNNKVLFVKKRDDVLERLFSAFSLFKDYSNDYYPTNTLNIDLLKENFDLEYEQSNRYILKAGHLFKYKAGASDLVELIPGKTIRDDLTAINAPFVYTNPFMITVQKNPSIVGFYLNSIDQKLPLEYSFVNQDSYVQFICNNIAIQRNAMSGEDAYKMTVNIVPTAPLDPTTPIVQLGVPTDRLKVILTVEESGSDNCYIDMQYKSFDAVTNVYTYEALLSTDDYMTTGEKMRAIDVKNADTGEVETKLIPMYNCTVSVNAFFKYDNFKIGHKYDNLTDLQQYTLTNIYRTAKKPVDFITPLDIMRTRVKYKQYQRDDNGTMVDDYYMALAHSPLVGANALKAEGKFSHFLSLLYSQYTYLLGAIDQVTNNYGLDLKFYNTFGQSKNFVVGEEGEKLDRTNINIRFKVAPTIGTIEEILTRDLKIFIKEYIEAINNKGYNAIYISNMIQAIENNFPDVKYLKFVNINNYDSSVQVIENRGDDLNVFTKDDRRDYVPEYLTVSLSDITIDIIR